MSDLVERHSDRLDEFVPACPVWTARQLVAHLVGLARDLVDGTVDGWASERWTAAHVETFGLYNGAELVSAWSDVAGSVGDAAAFGDVPAVAFAFGDAVVHEADLRPALEPGSRVPADSVIAGLAAGIARWRTVLSTSNDVDRRVGECSDQPISSPSRVSSTFEESAVLVGPIRDPSPNPAPGHTVVRQCHPNASP